MIRPSTRVLGLITADAGDEWLVRLFNALYGFNGLDAAYMPFIVRADVLGKLLDGFVETRKAEALHVGPSLWADAAAWAKSPLGLVDAITPLGTGAVSCRFLHPQTLAPLLEQHLSPGATVAWVGDARVAEACLAPLQALEAHILPLEGSPSVSTLDGVDCLLDAALPGQSGPLPIPGNPRALLSACDWSLTPPRTRALAESVKRWSILPAWIERAVDETREHFGVDVRVPKDLDVAVTEKRLRPCQLTDDGFRSHYEHLGV
ncbi:MAG: hypothetical protein AB1938_14485 [Myxococcota bacterium]